MRFENMGKLLHRLAVIAIAFFAFVPVANAQNPYSAAYAVNDSIISHYDISQRAKMLGALGFRGGNVREAAIEQLIEDRLKLGVARDFGANISDDSLLRGIEASAKSAGTTAAALWSRAKGRGVSREAFDEYYTAQLIWREIVQSKFRQAADPTSVDLDNAINVAAAVTQETILLAEIALPFAERGEAATVAFAERLVRDLNNGASFDDAVKNFSRAATAANGGQIGWIAPERMPANIAANVLGLSAGQVAKPVRVSSGIIILKVIATKVTSSALQKQVSVRYAVLDLSAQENATGVAASMQRGLDECSSGSSTAANYGGTSGLFGPVIVNDVPVDIALALARLMPGKSEVVVNGNSVKLVQLCNRTTDLPDEVTAQLTNSVFGQKLGNLAAGYLLELRRNAIIEKR